jgi:hypothetical protein
MTTTQPLPECASTTTSPETEYSDTCISTQNTVRESKQTVVIETQSEPLTFSGAPLMVAVIVALVAMLLGAGLQLVKNQKTISHMQVQIDQLRAARDERLRGQKEIF